MFGNFLTRDLTETGTRVSKGAEGGGRVSLKIVVVLLGKRNDLEMSTGRAVEAVFVHSKHDCL